MIREDNGVLNKQIQYKYDYGGNITQVLLYNLTSATILPAPTQTIAYGYGDVNWKDKLTSYNGKTITYDPIGNPLTYDGYTYSWENGRQLAGINGNSKTISYKYNDAGIRTEKTVNGVTTKYTLNGDKVIFEDNGTDKIHYTYGGKYVVSLNFNGTEYYYLRNAQNDIIGLIDGNGNEVVKYTYLTYGKLLSIEGSLKDTLGVKNPYRYRGYRYDTDTGLYYLKSRYYNPEWGRFLNADGILGETGQLLTHNLFAYCYNNPVILEDSSGFRPTVYDGSQREPAGRYNPTTGTLTLDEPSIIDTFVEESGKSFQSEAISGVIKGVSEAYPKEMTSRYFMESRPNAYIEMTTATRGAKVAKVLSKNGVAGAIIGTVTTAISVWDNFHSGYNTSEAIGRSAIDIIGFAVGLAAVLVPGGPIVAILLGAGIGFVASKSKDYFYGKEYD